jgi:KUP system potassium uptake protein
MKTHAKECDPSRFGWCDITSIVRSMGAVFGDIGTSPLYTFAAIFSSGFILPFSSNVIGSVSLILWTLVLLVFLKYAWLAMSLGRKGEGGPIVLQEILISHLSSQRTINVVCFVTVVAISLFIGDAVVTPAISILTAVEGFKGLVFFQAVPQGTWVTIACLIATALFVIQSRGIDTISMAFGPIMIIWFMALSIFGALSIAQAPEILRALNPWHAILFLYNNGFDGFRTLATVILCATGAEAMYADMGHLGRKPILRAWYIVFIALVLVYLGQGSFLLQHPEYMGFPFFGMILEYVSDPVYVLFVLLSIIATVIASQALICGIFSVVYQGMNTGIIPPLKVDYTSKTMRSQVYISIVNWLLLAAVLFMIVYFWRSENLVAAYGLAVTCTMVLTGSFMAWIFFLRKQLVKSCIATFLTVINFVFFSSVLLKLPDGAYWVLIVALVPFAIILIYTAGQRKMARASCPIPLFDFLQEYGKIWHDVSKMSGTALFFSRSTKHAMPSYMAQIMFTHNIIYEDNIIVTVITSDAPFGITRGFTKTLAPGLRIFEISRGYMEMIDIENILKSSGIDEDVIFYGLDDIRAQRVIWKIYAFIKKITPTFVQYYKLPAQKLHGVVTSIELK